MTTETATILKTPILTSTKNKLSELQKERGHRNPGETIEYLLGGTTMDVIDTLSDDAMDVLNNHMTECDFDDRHLALQDLLMEFRDEYLGRGGRNWE